MYRVAAGLTGSVEHAESVANAVVARAVMQRIGEHNNVDRDRWFPHHTVLTSREIVRLNGYATAGWGLPRELADLPTQQREAFVLHHGERLDLRQLATAMDCSTTAAANHLAAATGRLRSSVADLGKFTAALPGLLAAVVPPPHDITEKVDRQVRQTTWRRRTRVVVRTLVTIVVICVIAWLCVRLRGVLLF